MKHFILFCVAILLFSSCKRIVKDAGDDVVRTVEKSALLKTLQISEKELGKTLAKAITVLPKESQEY